jgi:hypothetical protein
MECSSSAFNTRRIPPLFHGASCQERFLIRLALAQGLSPTPP